MSAQRYRSGPGLMDLAVLLPSGKWMRMANGVQLTAEQVATWTELEPAIPVNEQENPGVARINKHEVDLVTRVAEAYVETTDGLTFGKLAEAIEKGAYQKGVDDGIASVAGVRSEPEKLAPAVQRRALLEQFGQHHDGLTMREAAEKANLLGNPAYTSRFGSDLVKHGLVASTGGRRSGAQVLSITEMGRDELRGSA